MYRLAALFVALALCAPAAGAELVAHSARYALSLEAEGNTGPVVQGAGEMRLTIERTCEAWIMTGPFAFQAVTATGETMALEVGSRIDETLDGLRLKFESFARVNGKIIEATRGHAAISAAGDTGTAVFTVPEAKEVALPKGTGFPIALGVKSLNALAQGKVMQNYIMFDGSSLEGPFEVSDFAAGEPLVLETPPSGDTELLQGQSWRVQSDFFPYHSRTPEPQHTAIAQSHANGVVSRMKIDLGFMTLDAKLVEITRLAPPAC